MTDASAPQRILIFDDDADFRKLLELRLGKFFPGAELEEYDPIANGVPDSNFDWSRYDVLLLDYFLCIHGVTGLDILRQNRKNPLFPATIMLTGAGNEEIAVRALKSGVSDYIRKETLDKEELRQAILTAHDESKTAREKFNEATLHSHAFNKGRFYKQLEKDDGGGKRVLLVVRLDHADKLIEKSSVLVRDNVVRYIAKQAFEVFHAGDCNPSITRLGEISIGLIIDDPESDKTLGFNLDGLCSHLSKRPYKFDGIKVSYTVSIGLVHLQPGSQKAKDVMVNAKDAVEIATRSIAENSYHIFTGAGSAEAASADAVADVVATPAAKVEKKAEPAPAPAAKVEKKAEPAPAPAAKVEKKAEPAPAPAAKVEEKAEPAPAPAAKVEKKAEPAPAPAAEVEEKAEPAPAPAAKVEKKAEPAPAPAAKVEEKAEPAPAPAAKVEEKAEPAPAPAAKVEEKAEPVMERRSRERDESILDDAKLDLAGLELKRSFAENRVVQTFQPIISLLAEEEEGAAELYNTSLQLVTDDGETLGAKELFEQVKDIPAFLKYINRWMLRQAIGRAIHSVQTSYIFVMKISEASLADATLFNWLKDLLSGLEDDKPGKAVALELSAETFAKEQKKAEALMTFLHKSHGFRFMLSEIEDVETVKTLTAKTRFDLIKLSPELIKQVAEESSGDGGEDESTLLNSLKSRGMGIVVSGVEDATALTEVISVGADYAIGEFIGEASTQLDDLTNVESFEIS